MGVCVLLEGLQETPISLEGAMLEDILSLVLQGVMLVANFLPQQQPVGHARPLSRSLQSPRRTR